MCNKLIFLISFVSVLTMVGSSSAQLVGHWRFDGDLDDSVGEAHGTFNGGSPAYVAGRIGQGIDFDGVSHFVHLPSENPSAYTITLWVRPARTDAASVIVRTSGSGQTTHWSHQLRINPQGAFHHYLWVGSERNVAGTTLVEADEWYHVAIAAANDGPMHLYVNGEEDATSIDVAGTLWGEGDRYYVGSNSGHGMGWFQGVVDDVQIYDSILTAEEIDRIAVSSGGFPLAFGPTPKDSALYSDTWATISWRPGDFAVSHDVYIGDNFDDVNNGTADTFRGNQDLEYFIVGFPGYPYPDGLVPGTTYYWRIDEVNNAEPNSPWKGDVWSFSIPPKTAYYPDPADGAEFVDLNVQLKWTAGFGTKLHYVVFGEDFDEVNETVQGTPNGTTSYNPGPLKLAKTYCWRVDEYDGTDTYKGDVWSFTTEGAVSGPNPADGEVGVKPSVVLGWDAGVVADSHEVYFGTDADAVANATTTSPEYKGPKALGDESYDPDMLTLNTAYYWRIDEVNGVNPDSPWAGNVWSFSTGDFFVIDDFEIYDANDNQIWYSWHDGLGYGAPGTDPYFAGNGTGAAVGDETSPSYTEETIVHGGGKSMPVTYDNNKQGYAYYSEVEHTLTDQRDWTEEGVTELSLWFRGNPASVGSFVEGPVGTYTMTGSGADIWAVNGVEADEFHFAYKMLTGTGSMVAKVESIGNTNGWAKAARCNKQAFL
ncbi:LamG domain-containing protein [Planctomycetota bacterium]